MNSPDRLEAAQTRLLNAANGIADGLRRAAEEIQREAVRYAEDPNRQPMGYVGAEVWLAERVMHTVLWMVPNLQLDMLITHIENIREART